MAKRKTGERSIWTATALKKVRNLKDPVEIRADRNSVGVHKICSLSSCGAAEVSLSCHETSCHDLILPPLNCSAMYSCHDDKKRRNPNFGSTQARLSIPRWPHLRPHEGYRITVLAGIAHTLHCPGTSDILERTVRAGGGRF